MHLLKRGLQALGFLLIILLVYVAVLLVHGSLTDYQPEARLSLEARQTGQDGPIQDSLLRFVIWNLGYGGLGAESNFFYDNGNMLFSGGRMIRPPRELAEKYLRGIVQFPRTLAADFFLLQEVDTHARRSYYQDQLDSIRRQLPNYSAFMALNYQVERVPIPLGEPWRAYGQTEGGLATLSKYQGEENVRFQLPGAYPWPNNIFQLDRCVSLHRYPTVRGNDLVVMNVHLSAYDADGGMKAQQMEFLRRLCLEEYEAGNYIVVGGDWNQCPPYFAYDRFMPGKTQGYSQINISPDYYPEGWQWIYDPTIPTNRKVRDLYKKGETFETLIDFYLISPNVRVSQVAGINQEFQFSDHQPVWLEIELLNLYGN